MQVSTRRRRPRDPAGAFARPIALVATLARPVALAATIACLMAAAPAAANTDQYGNKLAAQAPCNPPSVTLDTPYSIYQPVLFTRGIWWVDYYGIPYTISSFWLYNYVPGKWGYRWNITYPPGFPAGIYNWHVLIQGNGNLNPLLRLLLSALSDTASVNLQLGQPCSVATARDISGTRPSTGRPTPAQIVRNVRWLTAHTGSILRGSDTGNHPPYPKARICGRKICVELAPHASWKTLRTS